MGRSPCCSKEEGLNKGAWTVLEDQILKDYIKAHGEGKWRSIPKKAGLKRCGKSCRLRWLNYLRPDIKRGNITPDEEDLIIRLHKLLGNRWSLIAGRLPGRTDNEIKNYWNSTLAKREKGNDNSNQSKKANTKKKKISEDQNTPKDDKESTKTEPQPEPSSDDTEISGQSGNNGVSSPSEDQGLSVIMDSHVGVRSCHDNIDLSMILDNDSDYYFKKFSDLDVDNYMSSLLVEVNNDGDRTGGGGGGFMMEEDCGVTTDCSQQGDMNNLDFGSFSSIPQSPDLDWIV